MTRDSIVAEVRQVREDYARRFNFDLWKIYEHLRQQEKLSDRPVVNRSAAGEPGNSAETHPALPDERL